VSSQPAESGFENSCRSRRVRLLVGEYLHLFSVVSPGSDRGDLHSPPSIPPYSLPLASPFFKFPAYAPSCLTQAIMSCTPPPDTQKTSPFSRSDFPKSSLDGPHSVPWLRSSNPPRRASFPPSPPNATSSFFSVVFSWALRDPV